MTEPITLASAAPLTKKVSTELLGPAKGLAARTKEKMEVKFRRGFEECITRQLTRASTVKTIISSNAPIPLLDIYVNLFLSSGKTVARDEDFLRDMRKYQKVIFAATAGAGKSMLMRYLYMRFLDSQSDRLPIFIELRDLNQFPTVSLMSFIRSRVADYIEGFSDQQLKYAFDNGTFILFLDGFDEINHDIRKERERELNDLAGRYEKLWISRAANR